MMRPVTQQLMGIKPENFLEHFIVYKIFASYNSEANDCEKSHS